MITPPENAHRTQFTVRGYEIGKESRITPGAFVLLLLEAAGQHAFKLGMSLETLHEQNIAWVLNRIRVRFSAWPKVREEIKVTTWPSGVDRMGAYRDYLVHANGQIIAWGTSSWAIIDSTTRKAVPMPDNVRNLHPNTPVRALTYAERIVRGLKQAEHEVKFRVREEDLDTNHHLNSVHYVNWAMEAIPGDVREGKCLRDLDILFRAEALYHDTVTSKTALESSEQKQVWRHLLIRETDQHELARVESTWE